MGSLMSLMYTEWGEHGFTYPIMQVFKVFNETRFKEATKTNENLVIYEWLKDRKRRSYTE